MARPKFPQDDPQIMPEQQMPVPMQAGAPAANQMPAAAPAPMMPDAMGAAPSMPAMVPMRPAMQVIGKDQVREAEQIRQRYKEGKANLEQRIIDNERWYKLRHWDCMRRKIRNSVEPASGWLFNAIANKHADAMDNFPAINVLPREESDKGEAKMLSSIIPVVLDQADFEQVYDEVADAKLKGGTGIYGIYWDAEKHNGLGDISIKCVDVLNLFWESGITNIQESRNVFSVQLVDNEALIAQYPQLRDRLGSNSADISEYIYDDAVDTTDKSAVVDWYYKKGGILHYCKYCNDEVLFATENEPEYAERGWYDHGLYPFVFDPLFRNPGTPCGFGYIDIGKDAQEYIDRGNQAILQNMLTNARPRHFIRSDGSVKEEEYADMTRDFVHVDGNLGQDSIVPIQGKPLSAIYTNIIAEKVNELKEVTGNRDISTGGTSSGVTAASAIAAMQEAGSKLSRDNIKASYRAYKKMILMIIELIRQFYDLPRCFRIIGERGTAEYVMYSNAGIQPQQQGFEMGIDMGTRVPLFDVEVSAQKASPYSKMAQNELALQFYSAGFFNPQMADQALACLDMMDFDGKDSIMQKIQQNQMMFQMMMMGMVPPGAASMGAPMGGGAPAMPADDSTSTGSGSGETKGTKDARQRVADSTAPR